MSHQFRAGDTVRHRPSKETWVLAYADGPYVSWCGWPEGEAKAADCDLVRAATDDEHRKTLEGWAASNARTDRGGTDRRVHVARRQLFALNEGFVAEGI